MLLKFGCLPPHIKILPSTSHLPLHDYRSAIVSFRHLSLCVFAVVDGPAQSYSEPAMHGPLQDDQQVSTEVQLRTGLGQKFQGSILPWRYIDAKRECNWQTPFANSQWLFGPTVPPWQQYPREYRNEWHPLVTPSITVTIHPWLSLS